MIDPQDLYRVRDLSVNVPLGLPVLAGLTGFSDAGSTINQVAENIFANFDCELIVEFSNDELLDYRSRRPIMYFERDHIESYEPAVLGLYLVHDEANQPFLYLNGYEPDFKWEAFVAAIRQIFEMFLVSSVTWVHSIPFPVPHTRPIGLTVSGNRRELTDRYSEWKPSTQVPGNVLHLMEYELTRAGIPIAGFVLLIPHYLAESDYPLGAIVAFEQITAATGLVFRTDPLREENDRFMRKLNQQVEENADLQRMVQNLEQGYANSQNAPGPTQMIRKDKSVPSADQIAAELEDYLATRQRNAADDDLED